MASVEPLDHLVLTAQSVADDLGFVALYDISTTMRTHAEIPFRIIGGHMVTLHTYRWGLGAELYRETRDADLGVPPAAVRDPRLIDQFLDLGYTRVAGNRFGRPMSDVPVDGMPQVPQAIVDILVPTYRTRVRQDRRFGTHLITTEVPGLSTAFQRDAVNLSIEACRLNGQVLRVVVPIPDEASALVLKTLSWRERSAPRDAVDIWRCLEVAFAAGVAPSSFDGPEGRRARQVMREAFWGQAAPGIAALEEAQQLSPVALAQRVTRIRALMDRVVGP